MPVRLAWRSIGEFDDFANSPFEKMVQTNDTSHGLEVGKLNIILIFKNRSHRSWTMIRGWQPRGIQSRDQGAQLWDNRVQGDTEGYGLSGGSRRPCEFAPAVNTFRPISDTYPRLWGGGLKSYRPMPSVLGLVVARYTAGDKLYVCQHKMSNPCQFSRLPAKKCKRVAHQTSRRYLFSNLSQNFVPQNSYARLHLFHTADPPSLSRRMGD